MASKGSRSIFAAANIAKSAYSSGDLYVPKGAKGLAVQGYDEDNPTWGTIITVEAWDPTGAAVVSHVFSYAGIQNGRSINIACITPAVCTIAQIPTATGHVAVKCSSLGGSYRRLTYCA